MSTDGDRCCAYFGAERLGEGFYDALSCEEMAKSLLGKVLVRRLDDNAVIRGRIVETESYLGGDDAASHSFNGKLTVRNEPMFMKPGTAYVYFTYGMYNCFNISSKGTARAQYLGHYVTDGPYFFIFFLGVRFRQETAPRFC